MTPIGGIKKEKGTFDFSVLAILLHHFSLDHTSAQDITVTSLIVSTSLASHSSTCHGRPGVECVCVRLNTPTQRAG